MALLSLPLLLIGDCAGRHSLGSPLYGTLLLEFSSPFIFALASAGKGGLVLESLLCTETQHKQYDVVILVCECVV